MNRIVPLIFILSLSLLVVGCKSTRANNQKTLASIQYAADAAMQLWGKHVAREQKRLDALPEPERVAGHAALLERRLKVDDLRSQFSKAWAVAWRAANFKVEQPATSQILALLSDLETAVRQYSTP